MKEKKRRERKLHSFIRYLLVITRFFNAWLEGRANLLSDPSNFINLLRHFHLNNIYIYILLV